MARTPTLRYPDVCPDCGRRGVVVNTRRRRGYIWRRHECQDERHERWTSYQHLISPAEIDPENIRPDHLLRSQPRPKMAARAPSMF
jgi:hypothetical protein